MTKIQENSDRYFLVEDTKEDEKWLAERWINQILVTELRSFLLTMESRVEPVQRNRLSEISPIIELQWSLLNQFNKL